MPMITRGITQLLAAVGLWVYATACGPPVVDLGARGGGFGAAGAGAGGLAASGSGGDSDGGAAGSSQVVGPVAGAGAAAVSGAASEPSVADAGGASPLDAAVADPRADPSPGCGLQPPASDTTITINGATASYLVDLATGYDPNRPYPLVMAFRGPNVSILAFSRDLDLPAVVGADGIVVYVDIANGVNTWDLQRDRQVFLALLPQLEASYCIDRRRVFVVGHSTGAIFANVLACMHSGMLRGLGSLNGVEPRGMCTGGLGVWISQGNADITLLGLGQGTRDFWVGQNHCNASMDTPVAPSPCLEYMGCEPGSPVRYCEYDGNVEVPSFAADAVWNFFKGL